MNFFDKIVLAMQKEMDTPVRFGWFHILCIILMLGAIFYLYKTKDKHNEKRLKVVLGTYGVVALLLEIAKQVSWSFNYNSLTNVVVWDYQWYAFPFQLCTTPIYVSLICLFLKDGKVRKIVIIIYGIYYYFRKYINDYIT